MKIISFYHPAAALHNPNLWSVMLNDWQFMPEQVPTDYVLVEERKSYPSVLALDTETEGNNVLGQWSVAYRNKDGRLNVERYYGARRDKTFDQPVVMHNAKFDIRVLEKAGMKVPGNVHDTMVAAYTLDLGQLDAKDSTKDNSGSRMVGGLGLKYLARRHLGAEMKTWKEIKDHPEVLAEYNDMDSIATYLLWEKWEPELPEHYFTIDMPLVQVLMAMEDKGIAIDPDFLVEYAKGLDEQLAKLDCPVNPYSNQQIQSYVYGTLGIEPWKFTESKAPSTDEDVLSKIDDPIVKQILRFRELHKDKRTYVENYIEGSKDDGRIHPEFKQVRTATGRLSCANPNLQNVDKDGDMRKLFVASEGMKLVRLDYKQLEFIVLAALLQDSTILEMLGEGYDFHTMTERLTGKARTDIKPANFATIYGAKEWTISKELGITIREAKELQQLIFSKMPALKRYIDQQREIAHSEKQVINHFGRKRRIDAMYARDWRIREHGERQTINMPVQSAAAEVVKLAMIDLHYKHHAPILLQVHDELIFEVPEREAEDYAQWLREYVPTITQINGISFPVDVGTGSNWKEAGG